MEDCNNLRLSNGFCYLHYGRMRLTGSLEIEERTHTTKICSVEGCSNLHACKGWCGMHYARMKRSGSLELKPSNPRICSVEGCDKPYVATGWCGMHYNRMKRRGSLELPAPKTCSVEGCDKVFYGKDWCRLHYYRMRLTGSVEKAHKPIPTKCSVQECERVALARGWCSMHYNRWRTTGTTEENQIDKEKIFDSDGYVLIWDSENQKYIREHRYMMAEFLDRPLNEGETVHHINGNRADNKIENLQLRQGHHGSGIVMRCLSCGSQNVTPVPIKDPE